MIFHRQCQLRKEVFSYDVTDFASFRYILRVNSSLEFRGLSVHVYGKHPQLGNSVDRRLMQAISVLLLCSFKYEMFTKSRDACGKGRCLLTLHHLYIAIYLQALHVLHSLCGKPKTFHLICLDTLSLIRSVLLEKHSVFGQTNHDAFRIVSHVI